MDLAFFTALITDYGLLAVFAFMMAESALIPIPSEVTMPLAGFLTSLGFFDFWTVVFVGTTANLLGALILFHIGKLKGDRWLTIFIKKWGKHFFIKKEEYDRSKKWFKKYGKQIVFTSRLLPIIRAFISLPAGISKMNVYLFTLYTLLGSFIWVLGLTYLGVTLEENWLILLDYFRQLDYLVLGGLFLVIAYAVYRKLR